MKLINKLKPEILTELNNEVRINYSISYRYILASLSRAEYYHELTVDEIKTLSAFLPEQYQPKSQLDYFYGRNILSKEFKI